jgi:uncharacterized protein (TIGR02466 family)
MINFLQIAPVMFGTVQVDKTIEIATLQKVQSYLSDNSLESPINELVKSTYETDKQFLKTANLTELESLIISYGSTFLGNLGFNFDRELKITSWLNVFDKDIMEAEHTHYKSMLSGCYYVDSDGTSNSGCFYIIDQIPQREQNRSFYNLNKDTALWINPVPGSMIFFESWVRHGVLPNRTDKKRISIAFNID